MKNTFEKLCKRGVPALGFYISDSDVSVAEMAGHAGYDYMRVDMEHTLMDLTRFKNIVRVCDSFGMPTLVRVANIDDITRLLDFGASGILVPDVATVEQAKDLVRRSKYAPVGQRGMGKDSRHTRYGLDHFDTFIQASIKDTALCVQIESVEGMRNLEGILSLQGVDMVAVGKFDLAQSMGYPGNPNHPEVAAAELEVIKIALKHGVHPMVTAGSKAQLEQYAAMGVSLATVCFDIPFIFQSIRTHITQFK